MDLIGRFLGKYYDANAWIGHIINVGVLAVTLPLLYAVVKPWKVATFGEVVLANPTLLGLIISATAGLLVVPPFVLSTRSTDIKEELRAVRILTFGPSIGMGSFLGVFITIISDPKPDAYLIVALALIFAFTAMAVAMSFWYMWAMSRTFQRNQIDVFAGLGTRLPIFGLIAREFGTRRRSVLADDLSRVWLLPSSTISQEERDEKVREAINAIVAELGSDVAERVKAGLWANYRSYTLREPMPLTPDGNAITERLDVLVSAQEKEKAARDESRQVWLSGITESGIAY